MKPEGYFRILKIYADIWARTHCRVILRGEENIDPSRPRIYIVSHPTTWDLPLLVHISKRPFSIVVNKDPFQHPLVSWIFGHSGFLQLTPENSEQMIASSCEIIKNGTPMIYSLKGYGVDFGEDVRPRTGSIRIAHYAGADICPIHLMIEEGKRIFKYFRKGDKTYPYTIFKDTFYFATFLKPLTYAEYAKENMTYDDYKTIANRLEEGFVASQKRVEGEMAENAAYYGGLRKTGGTDRMVIL